MYGDHRSKQAHRWVDTVEATKDLYVTAALGTDDDDDDGYDDEDDDGDDEFNNDEDDDMKIILFYRYESASLKS